MGDKWGQINISNENRGQSPIWRWGTVSVSLRCHLASDFSHHSISQTAVPHDVSNATHGEVLPVPIAYSFHAPAVG